MTATVAPVAMHRALPAEEAARADLYALLARLLHGAPDGALLHALANAQPYPDDARADLRDAWRGLVLASNAMDEDAAALEYEHLFVGMGKAPVPIYAAAHAPGGGDHPRVRILQDLRDLGLARPDTVTEPEDHLAGLLDVMRVLVAGGAGRAPAELDAQRRFYDAHLAQALPRCLAAIAAADEANYYRHVAAVGRAFVALETESFELE
jgi:TorA maturation chaperone TorD